MSAPEPTPRASLSVVDGVAMLVGIRITSYNVCYTKLLRERGNLKSAFQVVKDMQASMASAYQLSRF